MYVIEIEFATPQYDETVRLRDKILRKPLNLEFEAKDLAQEYADAHLACYDEYNNLLGCCVLSPKEKGQLKMRQVAVDEPFQRKGIGRLLVDATEAYAKQNDFKEIVLNARDVAIPFYEKQAYKKVGKPFTEVSIKHYKMTKKL